MNAYSLTTPTDTVDTDYVGTLLNFRRKGFACCGARGPLLYVAANEFAVIRDAADGSLHVVDIWATSIGSYEAGDPRVQPAAQALDRAKRAADHGAIV